MADGKRRPVYSDPAQVKEMHRLELGEAIATGDRERVDEMVGVMKARGDRDISWEKGQSEQAYYRFRDDEAKREGEFKPVTAEEMRAAQAQEETQKGQQGSPELDADGLTREEADVVTELEASLEQYGQQRSQDEGPGKYAELDAEHDRSRQVDQPSEEKQPRDQERRKLEFYKDMHPEQDRDLEH